MSLNEAVFTELPGDEIEMKLYLSGPPAREPLSFTIDDPARIVLDLVDTRLNLPDKHRVIGVGPAQSMTAVEGDGKTRVTLNLLRLVPYALRLEGNAVVVTLAALTPVRRTLGPADDRYVSRTEYDNLKQELEALKAQMQGLLEAKAPPKVAPSRPEPEQPPPQVAPKPAPTKQPPGAVSVGDREKEAERAKRDLDEFLRRQKLLFRPGEIELEFGAAYSQDTSGLNITGPDRVMPVLQARSAATSITARYGLAEDVEFNVSVPFTFVEQDRETFTTRESSRRTAAAGLSDVGGALRYAAWHEGGSTPEVVLSLSGTAPTGDADRGLGTTGWNVGGAVTLIKTLDPVVLFGSLGYTATLEADGIDPGDQIPYSLGMGFSLNDQVSVSAALGGTAVRRASSNGEEIVGSGRDLDSLQFSTTVQVSKYLFVEPFVGFGLTEESADFIAGINVPYRLPVALRLPFHN